MKTFNVLVDCAATYKSSIKVPDELTKEQALSYAKEHIDEIPVGQLNWVADSDVINEDLGLCGFSGSGEIEKTTTFDYDGVITKDRIKAGIDNNVISFATPPGPESGTACYIGDNWFWFGGETAEEETPEEYLANVPEEDVVDEIFDALSDFRDDDVFDDEYKYYDAVLTENGI